MTALGAAVVFLFRRNVSSRAQRICLGFAAGVMASAAVFSLLVPAIEQLAVMGAAAWLTASIAFLTGALLILALDLFLSRAKAAQRSGDEAHRRALLITAVTLHNVPEGMAVGVVYAGYLSGQMDITLGGALALSIGIAIQNFPEGAIISMPMRARGDSKAKSFFGGVLSGVVEPIGALFTILFAGLIVPALPYLLSFAAGAMIYVVVEELIPETSVGEHSDLGTLTFAVGFSIMMLLDVALG